MCIVSLLVSLSSGCIRVNNDATLTQQTFEKLVNSIVSKDSEKFDELFSNNVKNDTNYEANKKELFELITGEIVNISSAEKSGIGTTKKNDVGQIKKILHSSVVLETSNGKFHIAMNQCTIDTAEPNNIGIISIYVIKESDRTDTSVYRGESQWYSGINIVDVDWNA